MNIKQNFKNLLLERLLLINVRDREGRSKVSEIFTHPLFYIGLCIKVIFLFTLSSKYLSDLFIPVANYIQTESLLNFYDYFAVRNPDSFPYPPLMLLLLSPFFLIMKVLGIQSSAFVSGVIIKLTIFTFDLLGLIILYRWAKDKGQKVLYLYWLSPIYLIVSYAYGQLDCIPTTLAIMALYFLFKRKLIISMLIISLSILTKTHMAILLPLFVLYWLRNNGSKKEILIGISVTIINIFAFVLPFLNENFIQMVFFNNAQQKAVSIGLSFTNKATLYLAPFVIFILGIYTLLIKNLNKDTILMLIGFVFGCTLLFSFPSVGWYSWVIPFFGYFFIRHNDQSWLLFLAFQIVSILHIITFPHSNQYEVLNLLDFQLSLSTSSVISNLIFTLSKALLITTCIWIYFKGISHYSKMLLYARPFLIGIAGDSGSGKSTLSNSIRSVFGAFNTTILHGDDMHRWKRGDEKWSQFTHLNPKANELYSEYHFLKAMKKGIKASRRKYDHNTGEFLEATPVKSKPLIIFEGLHSFYLKHVRELFDLKIYLSPDENLRRTWKVERDVSERGKDRNQAMKQIEDRIKDGESFISPQKEHADIIIQTFKKGGKLNVRYHISNTFDISPIVDKVENTYDKELKIKHWYESDTQVIETIGAAQPKLLNETRNIFLKELDDFGIDEIEWENSHLSIAQLLITYLAIYKVRQSNEWSD